jgi:predicted RNase H-like HicB family nuclease
MATYRVVLKESEEGYSVHCPGLPGCWSQGATQPEAIENIRLAIAEYQEAEAESKVRGR